MGLVQTGYRSMGFNGTFDSEFDLSHYFSKDVFSLLPEAEGNEITLSVGMTGVQISAEGWDFDVNSIGPDIEADH